MLNSVKLSAEEHKLVQCMQLLGDPTRYKLYKLLRSNPHQYCVSELADKLNVSVSAVSQHFRSFELIGLVEKKRTGQKICYCLKNNSLLIDKISKLTNI